MPAIKKILGNRFARLILTIILVVVVATLVIGIQRARQRRKVAQSAPSPTTTAQPAAETAGATPVQTITTTAGGSPGTGVTYQVQEQGGVAEISPEEASAKQQSGEALILDVREARLFEARGCIKGAVNIPLAELPKRRGELPAGKLIITYTYAGIPAEAEAAKVAAAQLAGEYRTAVLKGSAREWITAGLPVELPKTYREKLEAEQKGKRDVK
jgi:rhodanese-related sulfurtransferase